jgi:hypothetical protein
VGQRGVVDVLYVTMSKVPDLASIKFATVHCARRAQPTESPRVLPNIGATRTVSMDVETIELRIHRYQQTVVTLRICSNQRRSELRLFTVQALDMRTYHLKFNM